jgi:hypothetical protein
MPTIIACFKWVVDEAYIRRGSSGELDFSSGAILHIFVVNVPLTHKSALLILATRKIKFLSKSN